MKKIRLLFQGDSVTDMYRNREDFYDLGKGYPKYAAPLIAEKYPDIEFEFINRGIGGNTVSMVMCRMQEDLIDLAPDIVTILVGVNDARRYTEDHKCTSDEKFENSYRKLLSEVKEKTNAKIMVIDPFLMPTETQQLFFSDLQPKVEIVRRVAREFADVYMPLDGLLYSEFIKNKPEDYSGDGVHPNDNGAELIARFYVEYVSRIIDSM